MHRNNRYTKADERQLMEQLAKDRQQQTPDREQPAWLAQFWARRFA